MVELARRYSNQPDLLNDLVRLREELARERDGRGVPDASTVESSPRRDPKRVRIARRMSAADVAELVRLRREGATVAVLADHFSIGSTAVKKFLREHKVRRMVRTRKTNNKVRTRVHSCCLFLFAWTKHPCQNR